MDVLDYVCTSDHVHLLAAAKQGPEISNAMRRVHGRMGQWHNGQRRQSGAFWADRYHATRIQSGTHLSRCLLDIDVNMVRAGAVRHPANWEHSAWSELTGCRQRYGIVNTARLLKCLGMGSEEAFRDWLSDVVAAHRIRRCQIVDAGCACYLKGVGNATWSTQIQILRFRCLG